MHLSLSEAKILLYILENLRGYNSEIIITRKVLINEAGVDKTRLSRKINNTFKLENFINEFENKKRQKRIKYETK